MILSFWDVVVFFVEIKVFARNALFLSSCCSTCGYHRMDFHAKSEINLFDIYGILIYPLTWYNYENKLHSTFTCTFGCSSCHLFVIKLVKVNLINDYYIYVNFNICWQLCNCWGWQGYSLRKKSNYRDTKCNLICVTFLFLLWSSYFEAPPLIINSLELWITIEF